MKTRREFIKLIGLASAGVIAGASTHNIFLNTKPDTFHLYGFLPAEENILKELALYIKSETGTDEISYTGRYRNVYRQYFAFSPNADLKIEVKEITGNITSDITRGNEFKGITPLSRFDSKLIKIREQVFNEKASLYFSAVYRKTTLLSIFNSKEMLVIENEKGVFEEIDASQKHKIINVPGPYGNTAVEIKDGKPLIKKASCKHKLCMKMNTQQNGTIACVPNKILITSLFA